MCEHITFPVKVCESCVIHRVMNGAYDSQLFLQPQRQTKTSLMKHNLLLWQTPLLPNCFCSCGSNVSCNHLGMRVYLMVAWSCLFRPTTEEVCASFAIFSLLFKSLKGQMLFVCLWGAVVVSWTWCDFAGPFVWLPGPSRLKVFPPVGFQHTWCFGTHEILKKPFVISR